MRDPEFRRSQENGLRLPHVAPINALVDELRSEGRGWVPYIAPVYGGVEARMLSILRDPGPMTDSAQRGSGFLCLENDDATAERFAMFLTDAGLRAENMVPWNAYPWYINRPPKAAELDAGVDPLRRLINVLPNVRVVMLNGREAQSIWSRYELRFPESATRLLALRTYHPSNQAFIGTREVREARLAQLRESFARAAAAIREEPLPR